MTVTLTNDRDKNTAANMGLWQLGRTELIEHW